MEYVKEKQVLLHEELYAKPVDENDTIVKATKQFRENIKLAHYAANKFSCPRDPALDEEDILQCAYQGLWEACLNFDESKGFEFSTYGVASIRGRILQMLRDNGAIHEPRSFKDIRSALTRHGFSLPLSDMEVDILLEEKVASRAQILSYVDVSVTSIDLPIESRKGDKAKSLSDFIPDDRISPSPEMDDEEIEQVVDIILKYIKPQARPLVEEWMYATLAGYEYSQMEWAAKYGISQSIVSRYLRSAVEAVKLNGEEIRSLFGY